MNINTTFEDLFNNIIDFRDIRIKDAGYLITELNQDTLLLMIVLYKKEEHFKEAASQMLKFVDESNYKNYIYTEENDNILLFFLDGDKENQEIVASELKAYTSLKSILPEKKTELSKGAKEWLMKYFNKSYPGADRISNYSKSLDDLAFNYQKGIAARFSLQFIKLFDIENYLGLSYMRKVNEIAKLSPYFDIKHFFHTTPLPTIANLEQTKERIDEFLTKEIFRSNSVFTSIIIGYQLHNYCFAGEHTEVIIEEISKGEEITPLMWKVEDWDKEVFPEFKQLLISEVGKYNYEDRGFGFKKDHVYLDYYIHIDQFSHFRKRMQEWMMAFGYEKYFSIIVPEDPIRKNIVNRNFRDTILYNNERR